MTGHHPTADETPADETSADDAIAVRFAGATQTVQPGSEFSFGRSADCTLSVGETDLTVSRLAGRLERDGELWWVVNASTTRPLAIVDEYGLRSVLPPGRRRAAEGPTRVLVEGNDGTYELVLEPATAVAVPEGFPDEPDGPPTAFGEQVVVNAADRAALVALFAGYLEEGARYDPNPKSYAAAAARLGWPRTTLVKRVEYLRARLSNSGVPNLTGPFALNNLAEYALTTGLVGREDLTLIKR